MDSIRAHGLDVFHLMLYLSVMFHQNARNARPNHNIGQRQTANGTFTIASVAHDI